MAAGACMVPPLRTPTCLPTFAATRAVGSVCVGADVAVSLSEYWPQPFRPSTVWPAVFARELATRASDASADSAGAGARRSAQGLKASHRAWSSAPFGTA